MIHVNGLGFLICCYLREHHFKNSGHLEEGNICILTPFCVKIAVQKQIKEESVLFGP